MPDLDITQVAHLARLKLSPEETELFQKQLADVLAYAEKLREVDVSGLQTSAHVSPVFDVFREDEARPGLSPAEALGNAPRQANDLFVVPKVVE